MHVRNQPTSVYVPETYDHLHQSHYTDFQSSSLRGRPAQVIFLCPIFLKQDCVVITLCIAQFVPIITIQGRTGQLSGAVAEG